MLIDFHFEFTFVAIVTPMVKHNTGMKYTTEISVSLVAGRARSPWTPMTLQVVPWTRAAACMRQAIMADSGGQF